MKEGMMFILFVLLFVLSFFLGFFLATIRRLYLVGKAIEKEAALIGTNQHEKFLGMNEIINIFNNLW